MVMAMERLSQDLNLALEESSCDKEERRKLGFRRRARSAGNLPAAVAVSLLEDGSSSSPPQVPVVTQPLSDSDEPQVSQPQSGNHRGRHYCQIGYFESDSFNENFSPTRLANSRRKRKYKKTPGDNLEGHRSPPLEILCFSTEPNATPSTSKSQTSKILLSNRLNKDRSATAYCGKRKWSDRDKSDCCEMRERSFSGGCTSKSGLAIKNHEFLKYRNIEKKRKECLLQPGRIMVKPQNMEEMPGKSSDVSTPSMPGSSSFNFVYKTSSRNGPPQLAKLTVTGYRLAAGGSPFCHPIPGRSRYENRLFRRTRKINKALARRNFLQNTLDFDDSNSEMDCMGGTESSSLSSSDSDDIVTNDSDREGDDELTDWPGIEELKVFNKSLTIKTTKLNNNNNNNDSPHKTCATMPPPKRLKKEKSLVKGGLSSCKNRFKKKRAKVDSGNDDDVLMSDSQTVIDAECLTPTRDMSQPSSSIANFTAIKNEMGSSKNVFYRPFASIKERSECLDTSGYMSSRTTPRTNFALQKTSSSDLNVSEKSPQSDHYCSEHSASAGPESREIRAGCRRLREERPGLLIHSAVSEQLARFLQDPYQNEIKLPTMQDPSEKQQLESLARLYSLELQVDMGRPLMKKTSNTTQVIRVEHVHPQLPSDHKRRCYGEDCIGALTVSVDACLNAPLPDDAPLSPLPDLSDLEDVN